MGKDFKSPYCGPLKIPRLSNMTLNLFLQKSLYNLTFTQEEATIRQSPYYVLPLIHSYFTA